MQQQSPRPCKAEGIVSAVEGSKESAEQRLSPANVTLKLESHSTVVGK